MLLNNFLSSLPWPLTDVVINIVAALGVILLTYGVFLEAERRQDAVFIIASACLLVYALWIGNNIFSLAMAGLLIGSFIEWVEILTGKHKHVCVPDYHKD